MLNLTSRSQLHSTKMSENMILHIKMQDRILHAIIYFFNAKKERATGRLK